MTATRPSIGRWIAAALAAGGLATVFHNLLMDNMPKGEVRKVENYTPWTAESLRTAAPLPIQDGGRIKPLSTYAGFTMLRLHGARSMKISDDKGNEHKLHPTGWLLDLLFRPKLAIQQPTFRIDNSAAIEAIGIEPRGKRDRYSYADIAPGRDKLGELAQSYSAIDSEKRDPMQTQVLDLAANVRTYEGLLGWFSFARSGVVLTGSGADGGPDKRAEISGLMMVAGTLQSQLEEARASGRGVPEGLQKLLQQVLDAANYAKNDLFILPPADAAQSQWKSAGNVIMETMQGQIKEPGPYIEDIQLLEAVARSIPAGEEEFRKQFTSLRDHLAGRAAARGEGARVPLEVAYYQRNWFLHALVFFLIGTLTAMAMWTFGDNLAGRICTWATTAATVAGLAYCTIAITKRCIIMQRPPIGNLYDTIIFIGTTVVMLALLTEWLTRRRFALGVAPILGTALIVLARRFELGDGSDHMDPLVAVLDSNFWLTTHVITITLGYSAGLLAAFLSSAYVLLRCLGLDGGDRDLRRSFTRAVYGMICVTLFLSLVGTVLGGIWANYSWGRFWGWDPKENGALMICIWTLAILHARLGGYIREWGIHLSSIFTAVIITFSWWHVNFLGVGLHNYGFTAGKNTIWVFYACMMAILATGFIAMAMDRAGRQRKEAAVHH
jgi:ABC-type transport system involved in cytochrome c biogenesis permease subunit